MLAQKPKRFLVASLISLVIIVGAVTAGCNSQSGVMNQMPEDISTAPVSVQQAYQFAVANPELMKQIPCYCGCGKVGHTSNYSCYVASEKNGKIEYDSHAVGCSICVDITQDAMRLLKDGKSPGEIKAYVDNTYSKYGPSNIP